MMYKVFAAGGRGTEILRTESFRDAVAAAYENFGWITDENGNEIPITDENGEALYDECPSGEEEQ